MLPPYGLGLELQACASGPPLRRPCPRSWFTCPQTLARRPRGRHGRPCSTGSSECTHGSVHPAQERAVGAREPVLQGLALPRHTSRPRSLSWGAAVQPPPRKPPASWGCPGAGQREGCRTRPAAPRPGATYPGKCLSERRARREENTRLVGDRELRHGHGPWAEVPAGPS